MAPQTIRWGIIATGGISKTFSLDLLLDPASRGETSIRHEIVAVGSRSVEKAAAFIKEHGLGEQAKACGTYAEVYADENVDVVYIGSPHSHHYANVKEALEAGKNVLCEKAFTVNAKQVEALIALAKQKNVFLMEAMWTRFFPCVIKFQEIIQAGTIGKVERIFSDLSMDFKIDTLPSSSRLVDPHLAGGALLDLGPYALNWVLLPFFPHPNPITAPKISAQQIVIKGVDMHTNAIFTFPDSATPSAIAMMSCSMAHQSPKILIQGSGGDIELLGLPYRPTGFIVRPKGGEEKTYDYPAPEKGAGMFWEADEVARCVAAGKKESERMPHATSVSIMTIFDEIRKQGGHVYPDEIEKL